MNSKRRIRALCIVAAFIVVVGSVAVFLYNKDSAKAAADTAAATSGITDISGYQKKITVADNHLPSADITSKGGNGLQLYDTQGNFINGDDALDGKTEFTVFLRVLWLENQDSDLSLIVLADNHVQQFKVDDSAEKQSMLDFSMQPKSLINIPLSIEAVGDIAQENSTITFLLLYNNPSSNLLGELPLPNATNSLSYKIVNLSKKDFKDSTLTAADFVKQNDTNASFVKTKGFYSVLSSKNDTDFTFYREKQKQNIANTSYYTMGLGSRLTFMMIGGKLISPFENKAYLTYSLNDQTYLKQKLTFGSDYNEGDRLTIVHIEQNTPLRYYVDCHELTKN